MKSFFKSKINAVAILTIILGALTAASTLDLDPQTTGIIIVAIGTINAILRTYFTSTLISK